MTVLVGDCLRVMPTLEAESVDAIVCDPPYGLSFMGKEWDHGVPGVEFWTEALRVAKPGAHLVAFGGTRTFHRLAVAIEDAGWEMRDCLSWLYGSGFPKSHNGPWGGTALKPAWEPILLARKPLDGTVAANVAAHGTGGLNIDGCRIGSPFVSSGGPPGFTENKGWNANSMKQLPAREMSGRWPANVCLDEEAGKMLDQQSGNLKAGVAVQRNGGGQNIGTGRSYAGSKGLTREDVGYGDAGGASRFFLNVKADVCECARSAEGSSSRSSHPGDSAPSDAVIADNHEDRPQDRSHLGPRYTPDSESSIPHPSPASSAEHPDNIGTTPTTPTFCESCGFALPVTDASTSQASGEVAEAVNVRVSGTRFLYSAKASRSEREAGLDGMPLRSAGTLAQDKWSQERFGDGGTERRAANHHPTVKPIALMRWLCRLVTPPGGLILDPFTGSGTTGCAAVFEGFRFLGIEQNPEYAEIAEKRIAHYTPAPTLL